MSETTRKTIGQLNGPWAFLQKFMLAMFPLIVAWGVWTTSSIFGLRSDIELSANSRFSSEERKQILTKLENLDTRMTRIEGMRIPPQWFEDKVNGLQSDVTCLKNSVQRLEVIMMENQVILKSHIKDEKGDAACLNGCLAKDQL